MADKTYTIDSRSLRIIRYFYYSSIATQMQVCAFVWLVVTDIVVYIYPTLGFPIVEKTQMAHPIHQANENSPFGELTREEFYHKHQVLHQESFMLNKQNVKIFTQSWQPAGSSSLRLRGLVAVVHGYTDESSWLIQLNAVGLAKAGFYVCALDLQGHGYSDGSRGHIPNIEPVVEDCILFFDSARAAHPKLPAFLFGEVEESRFFKPCLLDQLFNPYFQYIYIAYDFLGCHFSGGK